MTLANDEAYKELHSLNSSTSVTFDNIKNGDVNGAIIATSNGTTVTYDYLGTALTGATDNLDVMLSAADGDLDITGATAANALETLTLNSVSDGELDDIDLTNANTTKLVITGAGATNVKGITGAAATLNTYDASGATGAVTVTGVNLTSNTVTGGAGNDTLAGAAGNDVITGGAGDDQITGGAGNDNLDGGAGNDTVILSSVTKDDVVKGGDGLDTLVLASGTTYSATENAGVGISGFEVLASAGAVSQNMKGLAENTITVAALAGAGASLVAQESAITTVVGAYNGSVNVGLATDGTADALSISLGLVSAASNASLTLDAVDIENLTVVSQGADGNVLTLDDDTAGTLTVATASVTDTDLKSITILGDKNLTVTHSGDDSALASIDASGFTGNTLAVTASSSEAAMTVDASGAYSANITAGKGADTITVGDGGTANANTVNGGDGADTIVAGAGNDTLNAGDDGGSVTAGAGDDTVSSGDGADTIVLGDGNDTVSDSGKGADVITGGAGNDTVTTAGAGADSIDGGAGNDNLSGGADNDTILGGAGNDTLNGDAGNDSIVGGDGNDTITDGAGNDVVLGGDGVDTITISTGNDNVDAGAGNDIITITGLSNADTITGGDGTDSLTITNASTGTLTPQFTSIESLTVKTSVNFALNQTDATDTTSLKTFTISSTESTSDSVNLTKIASGSTVNISEDLSWDGASALDTDDTGDIGEVNISTVDGGTLTLNVHADQDAVTHADTTFANVTDLTGAATITINSKNSDSNDIQNSLVALGLDDDETQTLVINAEDSAGLVVGNVTNAAALQSLTFASAAGAVSTMGTLITATALNSLSLSSTGSSSSLTIGKIGGTTDATLESLTISATGSSTTEIDGIDSASSTALTSVSISATGANSKVVLGGDTTNIITTGTGTIASLVIDVDDNAILEWADDSITSGAITAGTLSFGDYSTLRDEAADGNEDLTLTGAVTTLGVSLGRGITNAAADSIVLSGAVTTLNLSSTLGNEAIAMDTSNDLAYGGNELIQFGAVTKATYTHTGTGELNWVGDNIATNIVSSNASSTTADTIEGGSANDVLKGNAGGNIMEGNAGNDTIYGYAGADSITGSAGNDVLSSGEGADTVDGGAGNDTLTLTESTAAADVAGLTNGVAAITTVGTGSGDDAGADTITGYDTANDTLTITATGVTNFVHGTDTGFGQAGDSDNAAASTVNVTANELATTAFYFDFDTASNVYLSTATVDMVVNMASLKTSGVAYTLTSDTAMEATINYAITGTAAADTITAGGLADTITGGAGADVIDGGAGQDTYTITAASQSTLVDAAAAYSGIDVVTVTDTDLFSGITIAVVETNEVSEGSAVDTNGDALRDSLHAAFQGADDGVNSIEAMVIAYTGGEQFLVIDANADGSIDHDDDVIVQLVGTVSGLTLTAGAVEIDG